MKKSTHSKEYKVVVETLVAMRKDAGMTQRELAAKLQREHSFVWRIESGERRLDVLEFNWVCQALNRDASEVYSQMADRWSYPKLHSRHSIAAENLPDTHLIRNCFLGGSR
jgi:transcriptional regulator with XRE-family HTH domain